MKLLIRNLARTTTEAELREIFEVYGKVQSCNLVLDKETGTSKGFGFVEMPIQGEAKAAMKVLNGVELAGSKIRVKKAETKPAEPSTTVAAKNDADIAKTSAAEWHKPGRNTASQKKYDGKKGKGRGKGRGARS